VTERGESVTKLLISVAVALLVAGPASAQFKMADLGTLPGDADSAARHINNRGMIDLGTLDEISSSNQPTAINDRGQVVGVSVNALSQARGFLWTADTGMIDLGTLGGPISRLGTIPQGMNNRGEVVGQSNGRAFLWTAQTGMIDLGILGQIGPTSFSEASAINDRGHVVGRSSIAPLGGPVHTFLWTAETGMIDLGTLGGLTSSANALRPINNRGEVTGFSTTASSAHAFIWTDQNGMIDLGALGADGSSHAGGINELGQVVGASSFRIDGSPITHATLWTR